MVMAKLHMICGNCGCNDMFEYEISGEIDWDENDEPYSYQTVYISCKNCGTLHNIDDNANKIPEKIGTIIDIRFKEIDESIIIPNELLSLEKQIENIIIAFEFEDDKTQMYELIEKIKKGVGG
jgi:uncharacterized Zn finger protein